MKRMICDFILLIWIIVMKIIDIFTTRMALTLGGKEAGWLTRHLIERYGVEVGLEYDFMISIGTLIIVFIMVSAGVRKIHKQIDERPEHKYRNIIRYFLNYLRAITSISMFLIPTSHIAFSNLLWILNTLSRS